MFLKVEGDLRWVALEGEDPLKAFVCGFNSFVHLEGAEFVFKGRESVLHRVTQEFCGLIRVERARGFSVEDLALHLRESISIAPPVGVGVEEFAFPEEAEAAFSGIPAEIEVSRKGDCDGCGTCLVEEHALDHGPLGEGVREGIAGLLFDLLEVLADDHDVLVDLLKICHGHVGHGGHLDEILAFVRIGVVAPL